jgi:hypothetical protein
MGDGREREMCKWERWDDGGEVMVRLVVGLVTEGERVWLLAASITRPSTATRATGVTWR